MTRRLIIDTANLWFRMAAMNSKQSFGSDEERAGMALHTSFQMIHKYYKKFKPDQMFLSFEGKNNWRIKYTRGDWGEPITPNVYKANRVKDPAMEPLLALIASFQEVLEEHTTAMCVQVDSCEGDDVIAGLVQKFHGGTNENIIISADRDFVQLLKYEGTRLIDPATNKDRTCDDIDFWIFEKCIRGDSGDNVHSAYPRVRKTKIEEAFNDDFKRQNMMEHVWEGKLGENGEAPKQYRVGDMFQENKILMCLDSQPEHIKEDVSNAIDAAMSKKTQYNNFQFMRFLGKHGLKALAANIHQYSDMLSAQPSEADMAQEEVQQLLEF